MPPIEKGERQFEGADFIQSSSNSLPQSGAAQPILIFDASGSASTRGERTTQLPHFGQVTRAQEIAVLYGELDDMSRRRFYETRSKAS